MESELESDNSDSSQNESDHSEEMSKNKNEFDPFSTLYDVRLGFGSREEGSGSWVYTHIEWKGSTFAAGSCIEVQGGNDTWIARIDKLCFNRNGIRVQNKIIVGFHLFITWFSTRNQVGKKYNLAKNELLLHKDPESIPQVKEIIKRKVNVIYSKELSRSGYFYNKVLNRDGTISDCTPEDIVEEEIFKEEILQSEETLEEVSQSLACDLPSSSLPSLPPPPSRSSLILSSTKKHANSNISKVEETEESEDEDESESDKISPKRMKEKEAHRLRCLQEGIAPAPILSSVDSKYKPISSVKSLIEMHLFQDKIPTDLRVDEIIWVVPPVFEDNFKTVKSKLLVWPAKVVEQDLEDISIKKKVIVSLFNGIRRVSVSVLARKSPELDTYMEEKEDYFSEDMIKREELRLKLIKLFKLLEPQPTDPLFSIKYEVEIKGKSCTGRYTPLTNWTIQDFKYQVLRYAFLTQFAAKSELQVGFWVEKFLRKIGKEDRARIKITLANFSVTEILLFTEDELKKCGIENFGVLQAIQNFPDPNNYRVRMGALPIPEDESIKWYLENKVMVTVLESKKEKNIDREEFQQQHKEELARYWARFPRRRRRKQVASKNGKKRKSK